MQRNTSKENFSTGQCLDDSIHFNQSMFHFFFFLSFISHNKFIKEKNHNLRMCLGTKQSHRKTFNCLIVLLNGLFGWRGKEGEWRGVEQCKLKIS